MPESLPLILAGPILRDCTPRQFTLWLALSRLPESIHLTLSSAQGEMLFDQALDGQQYKSVPLGQQTFIVLISLTPDSPLPHDTLIEYQLQFQQQGKWECLTDIAPDILYSGQQRPNFLLRSQLKKVIHGSCRKPHCESEDALAQLDQQLAQHLHDAAQRPDLLIMSGDQIYADDVAGPMLKSIHQVIKLLGLTPESWQGATANNTQTLENSEYCYYQREKLLPKNASNQKIRDLFFTGTQKPIFTTNSAHNHLISFAEVIGMYLLVWSPVLWKYIKPDNRQIPDAFLETFEQETQLIEQFQQGLPAIQRAFAHLPVYMIFDDHDITDDWNLSRSWEEAAYGHPFSKRILGNALAAYWLCQGWGNKPQVFETIYQDYQQHFLCHDEVLTEQLIDTLLRFRDWDYSIDTYPKIIVADTRTNRWRSESRVTNPSGLMDWEALSELQQQLIHHESVILVSPAPIFGVKLIEVIQRIFTYFGQSLMVDAENWMAHNGSANVILNIFLHPKTPKHFVILSGDVHYSFVYDISLRFKDGGPDITQVTASGFKNTFPERLLNLFDRWDHWLYGRRSPLNWFTKRRRMQVRTRKPEGMGKRRLVNQSNLGVLLLDEENNVEAEVIDAKGQHIHFKRKQAED